MLGLLAFSDVAAAQSPTARNDIERLGLKNYPSKLMMVQWFSGLHTQVRRDSAIVVLCGPKVLEGLSDSARRGFYGTTLRYADSVVVEPECGTLPQVPVRGRSVVRIEDIVIGLDSSFVVARSTEGWDGRGPQPWREWLTERFVWIHTWLPGKVFFTVSGWNMVRDSPRPEG